MDRKNLSHNKGAMLALKYMAKCGLSDKEISRKLYDASGYLWSTSTIARRRRAEGILRESITTSSKRDDFAKKAASFRSSSDVPKTSIIKQLQNVNPDDLSFNDLCEYVASFFEDLANYPKGTQPPQEWWNIARDKVIHWQKVLGRTRIDFSKFTESQVRAYDYCVEMYTQSTTGGKYYRQVYSLYREWRLSFLKTTKSESRQS